MQFCNFYHSFRIWIVTYIYVIIQLMTTKGDDRKRLTEVRSSLFIKQIYIYFISLNLFCKREILHTYTHIHIHKINIKAQCISSTENTSLNPMIQSVLRITTTYLLIGFSHFIFDSIIPSTALTYFKRDRQLIFLAVYKL